MKVSAIKTHKVTFKDSDLFKILDKYLPEIKERSVLAITSKIIAICEGRMVRIEEADKEDLIKKEADFYLPRHLSKYNFMLSIKDNIMIASAGIDESNADGYYILWPENSQKTANEIRQYLAKRFGLKNIGVVVTDSKTTPLRWGVTGAAIAHSGFNALNNYIGEPDIFGRKLEVTKVNIMDALAASAVLVMGEGKEQTPLALISDIPFVQFQPRNPTKKELEGLKISIEDDLYAPLLTAVKWKKGTS